jgi:hypothetical protein
MQATSPTTSVSAASGLSYIEQYAAPHCTTRNRPFLRGANHHEKRAVLFRPRCGLWSCPYCAEINKRRWTARAWHGANIFAENGREIAFLTLTSSPKLSAAGTQEVFYSAWTKLRKRAQRGEPAGEYMMVPEQHQDGRLHAHAIETFNLGSRWWKDNAAACGLGYIAEEEPARTAAGAAWYISKYLAKTLAVTQWSPGFRRVRTSIRWPALPEMPRSEDWVFSLLPPKVAIQAEVERLEKAGYRVVVTNHAAAWQEVNAMP